MVIFQYNLYILGSIFEPCYIQNRVITNRIIKELKCIIYLLSANCAMRKSMLKLLKMNLQRRNQHFSTDPSYRKCTHPFSLWDLGYLLRSVYKSLVSVGREQKLKPHRIFSFVENGKFLFHLKIDIYIATDKALFSSEKC